MINIFNWIYAYKHLSRESKEGVKKEFRSQVWTFVIALIFAITIIILFNGT